MKVEVTGDIHHFPRFPGNLQSRNYGFTSSSHPDLGTNNFSAVFRPGKMADTSKIPEKAAEAVKDEAPPAVAAPATTTELPGPATTLVPEPSNTLLSAQHWAETAPPVRPANRISPDERRAFTKRSYRS